MNTTKLIRVDLCYQDGDNHYIESYFYQTAIQKLEREINDIIKWFSGGQAPRWRYKEHGSFPTVWDEWETRTLKIEVSEVTFEEALRINRL